MALTGNLAADQAAVKFDFPEAYARISVANTTKEEWRTIVNFYADASARALNAAPVLQMEFVTEPLATTGFDALWSAIYTYLKTQPIFAGWVDA